MNGVSCTYRLSVKAVITDNNNRVLLGHENDDLWELPGGGLDHGEDPRIGSSREIAEETGFEVTAISEYPVGFWTVNRKTQSDLVGDVDDLFAIRNEALTYKT